MTLTTPKVQPQGTQPLTQKKEGVNSCAICIVTLVALAAIASLITGGLFFHFHLFNPLVSYCLMGVGGLALLGDVIALVTLLCLSKKNTPSVNNTQPNQNTPSAQSQPQDNSTPAILQGQNRAYSIVSWNIGLDRDFANLCSVRDAMKAGVSQGTALNTVFATPFAKRPVTEQDKQQRLANFQGAFTSFNHPDIICLQECRDIDTQAIQNMLPGYTLLTSQQAGGATPHHIVAWRSDKFTLVNMGWANYTGTGITQAPDLGVCLQDKQNGTSIAVCSTHLQGYNLDIANIPDPVEQQKQIQRSECLIPQIGCDLSMMKAFNADIHVLAGDFNTTRTHLPEFFKWFESCAYITGITDTSPTVFDGNLKQADGTPAPIRLDHIYVRGNGNTKASFNFNQLAGSNLNDFSNRASDHLPVAGTISVS